MTWGRGREAGRGPHCRTPIGRQVTGPPPGSLVGVSLVFVARSPLCQHWLWRIVHPTWVQTALKGAIRVRPIGMPAGVGSDGRNVAEVPDRNCTEVRARARRQLAAPGGGRCRGRPWPIAAVLLTVFVRTSAARASSLRPDRAGDPPGQCAQQWCLRLKNTKRSAAHRLAFQVRSRPMEVSKYIWMHTHTHTESRQSG